MTVIRLHMTALPVTVAPSTDVLEAAALMDQHGIHHLPVLEDWTIRGVLSHQKIEASQASPGTPVSELLDPSPITMDADAPLASVAEKLSDARANVALIVQEGLLVGVVTSTDLADVVAGRKKEVLPSLLRKEILRQHDALRHRVSRIRSLVEWVRNGHQEAGPTLGHWLREYRVTFLVHLAQEEAHLFPALKLADGFGPVRVKHLIDEHARQRSMLAELIENLDVNADPKLITARAEKLVTTMLADMDEEARTALNPGVLKDDLVTVGFGG